MTGSTITRRLENGGSLPAFLDAAYDAFEEMLAAIRGHEDTDEGFFAGFMFAAAAADGRDAVLTAPSLPPGPLGQQTAAGTPDTFGNAGEITAGVAALSGVLAARLARAAQTADTSHDRSACHFAAQSAREIHDLLAGTRP